MTDAERHLGTYQWTDTYGRDRQLELVVVPGKPGVRAYAAEGTGRRLVAIMSPDGQFSWDPERARAYGLDTAAARNDLVEILRRVTRGAGPQPLTG